MRRLSLLLMDLVLVALATVCAIELRDNFESTLTRFADLAPYLAVTLLSAAAIFTVLGIPRSVWRFTAMSDYLALVAATVGTVLGAVALGFVINRLEGVARALPILQGVLMLLFMVSARIAARIRRNMRGRPTQFAAMPAASSAQENVLLVGLNNLTELYLRFVAEHAQGRVRIVGIVDGREKNLGRRLHGHSLYGPTEQMAEILRELEVHGVSVDRIVVTIPYAALTQAEQQALSRVEDSSGIPVEYLSELLSFESRGRPREARAASPEVPGGVAFVIGDDDPAFSPRRSYWRIKRLIDLGGALVLLVGLAPLVLLVALVVAADVGRPVTFWQQRPGLLGRPFRLVKFRTMSSSHDSRGRRVPDERRTSVIGAFLRRSRLDELPQLANVVLGEMSFIGPRPLLPVDQSEGAAARLMVRPGLTGWAQVMGGRDISPDDKAALDVWYVRNASLWLDLRIALLTVRMVVFGERVHAEAIDSAWRELRLAGICGPSAGLR